VLQLSQGSEHGSGKPEGRVEEVDTGMQLRFPVGRRTAPIPAPVL
jgi:hypothetical protein